MIEVVKMIVASYFLLLGITAVFGRHRLLLVAPAFALYSAFRFLLLLVSFGSWRLAAPTRSWRNRSRRSWRSLGASFKDWRQEEEDEEIFLGENWSSRG